MLNVGQGSQIISVHVGDVQVDANFVKAMLDKALEKLPPDSPVHMTFRKANFPSGHDLKNFAESLGIELQQGDVEQ